MLGRILDFAEASFMLIKKLDPADTDISKEQRMLSISLRRPPSYIKARRILLTGIAPGVWTALVIHS